MRALIIATVFLAAPAICLAQSTVGSVPSNPNAMPAVDGSNSPAVPNVSTKTTEKTSVKQKHIGLTRMHNHKASAKPD